MTRIVRSFNVIDTHTAGHPTRVVLSGVPALTGATVREMRDDFRSRFDHLRPTLLHEPRGHAAMVGLIPCPSASADYGAFFISSYVYLDMCGHGTIGYAHTLAATGQISREGGDRFSLETPAGLVDVGLVWSEDGRLDAVRLKNVPTRPGVLDLTVPVGNGNSIVADVIYSGMWYALVDAKPLGLSLHPDNVGPVLQLGSSLKGRIAAALEGRLDLGGLPPPSVLFYEERAADEAIHMLVLEANKFDRSPCGTGTSARLAQLLLRRRLSPGATYVARNIFGIPFRARVAEMLAEGEVVAEIEGSAYLTAFSTIMLEDRDPLARGFLCR